MGDKVKRFPPVRLALFALMLCILQWLSTLDFSLPNVRGLLLHLCIIAVLLVSFWGLLRRKAYGRWLGLVALILEWALITYAQVTRPEWPYQGGQWIPVITIHGLVHVLLLTSIFHLAFGKRVRDAFGQAVFRPRMPEVETPPDMDSLFARAHAQLAYAETVLGNGVKGQRAIAIVTPGRQISLLPCPAPGSMPEDNLEPIRRIMPPEPPLRISVVSYTDADALAKDKEKTNCIPFLGYLLAYGYLGHSVVIFEGHPSAFESGVRDCDVLLVDSGMLPFIQSDWVEVARRVMRDDAKIGVHERETGVVSLVVGEDGGQVGQGAEPPESYYAKALLVFLAGGPRASAEITSGRPLPSLADFANGPADLERLAGLPLRHDELNADVVIDLILKATDLPSHLFAGNSRVLKLPLYKEDGTSIGVWTYRVTLAKDAAGQRRILVER